MKVDVIVKEYVKRISDDDLAYLGLRFKQDLFGDKAEIAEKVSKDAEIDSWLAASTSTEELFSMIDVIGAHVKSEYARRIEANEEEDKDKRYKKRRRDT